MKNSARSGSMLNKIGYVIGAILAVLGIIFFVIHQGNDAVSYGEAGGSGVVKTTWRDQGYEKTTGGRCEIRFRLGGEDEKEMLISDKQFEIVSGNEPNVGGWIKVIRTFPKTIELHLYLDYGTFRIEHPCNGKWSY